MHTTILFNLFMVYSGKHRLSYTYINVTTIEITTVSIETKFGRLTPQHWLISWCLEELNRRLT